MEIESRLESVIKECLEDGGRSESEIYEIVNRVLIKARRVKRVTGGKRKVTRKGVCRGVLLISDSSSDE